MSAQKAANLAPIHQSGFSIRTLNIASADHQAQAARSMSQLAKLNLKSIERVVQQDRTDNRRRRLVAALAKQQLILEAQLKGETYAQTKKCWVKGANGERTQKKER